MPATPTVTSDLHREAGGTLTVNGVRLYCEEDGSGVPILCIHGAGSSALVWSDAVGQLARVGRVISYDRRGCTRSERPEPYDRTSVAEHADDAAALLDALAAAPAVVIGRSYGGTVAIDLALRYPDRVRALVVLEGDASRELAPATAEWVDALADRLRKVAAQAGVDVVAEALIGEVLGDGAWDPLPGAASADPDPERPGNPGRAAGRVVVAGRRRRARDYRAARPAGGGNRFAARAP